MKNIRIIDILSKNGLIFTMLLMAMSSFLSASEQSKVTKQQKNKIIANALYNNKIYFENCVITRDTDNVFKILLDDENLRNRDPLAKEMWLVCKNKSTGFEVNQFGTRCVPSKEQHMPFNAQYIPLESVEATTIGLACMFGNVKCLNKYEEVHGENKLFSILGEENYWKIKDKLREDKLCEDKKCFEKHVKSMEFLNVYKILLDSNDLRHKDPLAKKMWLVCQNKSTGFEVNQFGTRCVPSVEQYVPFNTQYIPLKSVEATTIGLAHTFGNVKCINTYKEVHGKNKLNSMFGIIGEENYQKMNEGRY